MNTIGRKQYVDYLQVPGVTKRCKCGMYNCVCAHDRPLTNFVLLVEDVNSLAFNDSVVFNTKIIRSYTDYGNKKIVQVVFTGVQSLYCRVDGVETYSIGIWNGDGGYAGIVVKEYLDGEIWKSIMKFPIDKLKQHARVIVG